MLFRSCPMCDSDTELTEAGIVAAEKRKKFEAELDAMDFEDDE